MTCTRRAFLTRGGGLLALSGLLQARPVMAREGQAREEAVVEHVTSRDGTRIGYVRAGSGPPLLLVHGATADRTRWAGTSARLESSFAVHAMDRRGRGHSGDAAGYAIEREFEDVAAVVDDIALAAGAPVDVLGHSFGGVCAMEGARLTAHLRRLVLYEPAGMAFDEPLPAGLIDRLDAMVAAGRREQALETFFREAVGMPDGELVRFRTLPAWKGRVASAHTLVRELRAVEAYRYDRDRIATVTAPTLVLAGGDSPPDVRAICDLIVEALPHGRLHVLPGQQHIAMDTAPDLFAAAVRSFLTSA